MKREREIVRARDRQTQVIYANLEMDKEAGPYRGSGPQK